MVKMDDFICFPFFHFSDFFNKKYDKSLIFSKLKKQSFFFYFRHYGKPSVKMHNFSTYPQNSYT